MANKKTTSEKSYNWVFTSWDVDPPGFEVGKMTYLCYEQETCPTTGKKHWQGFVGFKSQIRMKSVIQRLNCKTHPYVEIMKGSLKDNERYCNKENGLTKFGTLPRQGKRTDLETITQLVRNGLSDKEIINTVVEVEGKDSTVTVDYGEKWRHNYKGIQAMRSILFEEDRNWKMDVRIYYGKPGTGKTRSVFEEFDQNDIYCKTTGKWWDGYRGEKVVLIDDFDPANCFDIQYDFYLKLLDRYKLNIEVKGGMVKFYSRIIIFTSNFNPITWFTEKKNREAFFRRVTSIRHFELGKPILDLALDSKCGGGNIDSPPLPHNEEEILREHNRVCKAHPQVYEEF